MMVVKYNNIQRADIMRWIKIGKHFPQKRNPTLPYQDKKEKHKFVGNNIERETNYTVWLQIIYLANR